MHRSTATAIAVVALVVACGAPKTYDLAPRSARDTIEDAPDWMLEVPYDEQHLSAAATATSRDMQVAFDKARSAAQVDIGQQLGARLTNLTKQFQEETGMAFDSQLLTQFSSATKAITDETLIGTRIVERVVVPEGNVYRAYVLMQLPIGRANELLMQKIRGDRALHTRFRATEAYAELDDELRRYEEWRRAQQ